MPTLNTNSHQLSQYFTALQQHNSAMQLQDESFDLELTDRLLFGCEDEVDEPAAVAAALPSPHKPVGVEFLADQSAAVAEVAASVALVRSSWPADGPVLTAEHVAEQLAGPCGYGEMVRLRTTCAATKLQVHQTHTFAVCKLWTGEEVIVDVGFKDSVQLGCETAEYQSLLELLPADFVGTMPTLRAMLRVVCDAAAAAFAAHAMHLPPWRTYSSMLHRWTSTNSQDASVTRPGSPADVSRLEGHSGPMGTQRWGSGTSLQPRQAQHMLAPRRVVVGFPSDGTDLQPAGPAQCLPLPACRTPPPTLKHVSQQIDRLLGPIRKVKLGVL